jgi:pantoate--beta-alanine ligase
MKTVETIKELRAARAEMQGKVGLVPTMGYLHEGHLSMLEIARQNSDNLVVSIFVNPSQFGPNEDLDAYPRDLPRDLELLEGAGVDLAWLPSAEIMYPDGYQSWIELKEITQYLEGAKRPGHFRGVATGVAKLINATQADVAVFGQKDAQQVAVIKQMVSDLNMPVDILVGPIIREEDGLAKSSRNRNLNVSERAAANVLYRALKKAEKAYINGERSAETIRKILSDHINSEKLARLDYVSCAHPQELSELEEIEEGALLSMAVFVGKTRLIDNLILEKE